MAENQKPHCKTCTCTSPTRARLKKLYRGVPDKGCLYYRADAGFCGKDTKGGADYCSPAHGGD